MLQNKKIGAIIIVSGLPRSGTSMMMAMLLRGGLKVVVDRKRKPDKDNPAGYFEYQKVKNLDKDSSWLKTAQGSGLKVVSPLLKYLPPEHQYKVIFMERDLDEVLSSQGAMIKRRKKKKAITDAKMKIAFKKHLKKIKGWLKKQTNFETLFISYRETIVSPVRSAKKINHFLGGKLEIEKMASAVNPSFYRKKTFGSI